MFNNRSTPEDKSHYTDSAPDYPFFGRDIWTSIFVATTLMIVTIIGILIFADTIFAHAVLWLYSAWAFLGVVVIGAGITIGRWIGIKGMSGERYRLAVVGSLISVFTYSVFGGAVITPYNPDLYIPAIVITGGITILITIIAAIYVFRTDRNLQFIARYSGASFMVGLVAILFGTFVQPLLILGFALFLLGFLLDLVYEIWMITDGNRTPIANGFGLYIAFAGVFVHILQLVLRYGLQILSHQN